MSFQCNSGTWPVSYDCVYNLLHPALKNGKGEVVLELCLILSSNSFNFNFNFWCSWLLRSPCSLRIRPNLRQAQLCLKYTSLLSSRREFYTFPLFLFDRRNRVLGLQRMRLLTGYLAFTAEVVQTLAEWFQINAEPWWRKEKLKTKSPRHFSRLAETFKINTRK